MPAAGSIGKLRLFGGVRHTNHKQGSSGDKRKGGVGEKPKWVCEPQYAKNKERRSGGTQTQATQVHQYGSKNDPMRTSCKANEAQNEPRAKALRVQQRGMKACTQTHTQESRVGLARCRPLTHELKAKHSRCIERTDLVEVLGTPPRDGGARNQRRPRE